jgi:hypothetical protein
MIPPSFFSVRTLYVAGGCGVKVLYLLRTLLPIQFLKSIQSRRIVDEDLFADRRVVRLNRELVEEASGPSAV